MNFPLFKKPAEKQAKRQFLKKKHYSTLITVAQNLKNIFQFSRKIKKVSSF
jgi:hypothetical protein